MGYLQEQVGRIELELSDRHEIEVSIAQTDEQITQNDQLLAKVQSDIDSLQSRLNAAQMVEEMIRRDEVRLERVTSNISTATREQVKTTETLTSTSAILAQEEHIRAAARELTSWRRIVEDYSSKLASRQPIERRVHEVSAAIEREEASLRENAALRRQTIESLLARIQDVEKRGEKLVLAEAEAASLAAETAELPARADELAQLESRLAGINEENAALRSRMDDIQSRISSLRAGDATCPVCRRPLGTGDHEHIHEEWTVEGKVLGDAFRANKVAAGELRAQIRKQSQAS